MELPQVFEAFVRESPASVMARGILEYALPALRIDALFGEHASAQRKDKLLFSTVVEVLSLAVAGSRRSVHAAYEHLREKVQVSVISLYNKLKGAEPAVSQALVRETARRLAPVIDRLHVRKALLPGLNVKLLDGNHLAGTEHRLTETRRLNSQPLPGQALVVLDPQRMLMVDLFPCEDAYAQERSLLDAVLETVQAKDGYVADRNFCTTGFVFGLHRRQAYFILRQHATTLCGKRPVGKRRYIGLCPGGKVFEQGLEVDDPETGAVLKVRRITIELDVPTRNGEREIHLITNISARTAGAVRIAAVYRERWTIENAFQELGQALRSEIDTLCYPKAALLCFSVGSVLYNALSALKSAVRAEHPEAATLSGYYLAEEIGAVYAGLMIVVPPKKWSKTFGPLSARSMAALLRRLAAKVNPARFAKKTRGPKKPPPQRTGGLREKHVSTARLLMTRHE